MNYVANEMVRDRETKMKETLKIIGLESWIYSLSFLVQQSFWLIFPCLSVALSIYFLNVDLLNFGSIVVLFFQFWFYSLGMLSFTMMISNFFSSSKLVTMILSFIFFIPTGIAMSSLA